MKRFTIINERTGMKSIIITVFVCLSVFVAEPGFANDVFGYKLDTGVGSTKSLLEKQGYRVRVKRDFNYARLSSIEIFGFSNDYLKNMQLWISCFNSRTYFYKWDGMIKVAQADVVSIERLIKFISKTFGEPTSRVGGKAIPKNIDVSLLKKIANIDEGKNLIVVWKSKNEQIRLHLSPPLFSISDTEVKFILIYSSPDVTNQVISYQSNKLQ